MKLAAHPLVVAAALGLLGPAALDETDAQQAPQVRQADVEPDSLEEAIGALFELRDEDSEPAV